MSVQDEEISEESNKKKSSKNKDEAPKEVLVTVEAPKSRLITAFVMLSGSAFVAIYTFLQDYEIGDWLKTLFIGAVIFLIAGMLLEWLVTHFSGLINKRDDAIRVQEDAIAAREADELAAAQALEEAEAAAAAAAEEAALNAEGEGFDGRINMPNEYVDFGESDETGDFDDTVGF